MLKSTKQGMHILQVIFLHEIEEKSDLNFHVQQIPKKVKNYHCHYIKCG